MKTMSFRITFLVIFLSAIFCSAAQAQVSTFHPKPGEGFWQAAKRLNVSWVKLVAINRDRLVHRSKPNLIYTWQEFILPTSKNVQNVKSVAHEKTNLVKKDEATNVELSTSNNVSPVASVAAPSSQENGIANAVPFQNLSTVKCQSKCPLDKQGSAEMKKNNALFQITLNNRNDFKTLIIIVEGTGIKTKYLRKRLKGDNDIEEPLLEDITSLMEAPKKQSTKIEVDTQIKTGAKSEANKVVTGEDKKTSMPIDIVKPETKNLNVAPEYKPELEIRVPEPRAETKKIQDEESRSLGKWITDMADKWLTW